MADVANMVDYDGRISGQRLLKWLRGAEMVAAARQAGAVGMCHDGWNMYYKGAGDVLKAMADDLERELTPPDYPEDDGDTVDLDDPALGGTRPPCPVCGGSVVRGPQDADDLCVRCSPNR